MDAYLKIQNILNRLNGHRLTRVCYQPIEWASEPFEYFDLKIADIGWEGIYFETDKGGAYFVFEELNNPNRNGPGLMLKKATLGASVKEPDQLHTPPWQTYRDEIISSAEILQWDHSEIEPEHPVLANPVLLGVRFRFEKGNELYFICGTLDESDPWNNPGGPDYHIHPFGDMTIVFGREAFEKYKSPGKWSSIPTAGPPAYQFGKKLIFSLPNYLVSHKWYATLSEEEEQRTGLVKLLNQRPTLKLGFDHPVKMSLVGDRIPGQDYDPFDDSDGKGSIRVGEVKGEEDWAPVLKWHGGFGFNAKVSGPPTIRSKATIINEKIRSILPSFHLPEHEFIPVLLTHEVTGESRTYFIFHLLWDPRKDLQACYWPEMAFDYIDHISKEILFSFPKGTAQNVDDCFKIAQEKVDSLNLKGRGHLNFPYLILNQQFDLYRHNIKFAISQSLADALVNALGNDIVQEFDGPGIVGFKDPERLGLE